MRIGEVFGKRFGMKIVYSSWFPFRGFLCINLFGVLIVRRNDDGSEPGIGSTTLMHEAIHSEQMKEMGYIFFYLWYFVEWMFRVLLPPYDTAYKDISFEREANANQGDSGYLEGRRRYGWIKYLI